MTKRSREDDLELEEKHPLKIEYLSFLSRRSDKARLLAENNPNRLKNALFELSFYLNINHVNRESCWKYLEKVDAMGCSNLTVSDDAKSL